MRLASIILLLLVILVSSQHINALPSSEEGSVISENSKVTVPFEIVQKGKKQSEGESKEVLDAETYEQQLAETKSHLLLVNEQEVNRLLREKQQAQEERIKAQNIGLIVGGIFIVIILISLYMLYRGKKERDQMNAVLQEERKNLEELNEVKDKLLAIASHDLRSPLSSLRGMLELFKDNKLTEKERRQMLSELEIRLDQNINLLDNLLVWARDQMSGLTINQKSLSARQITDMVMSEHHSAAEYKGVSLVNNVREDLKVKADETLLQLVLRNLISNAVKFTDEGDQIEIEAESTGNEILFMVMDSGIGIPREKQEGIFSINSKSRAGTHNEQGSGLGLGLCKEFITKMGGSISVESEEGEGTTFVFSLPIAHSEPLELKQ
ncbi:adaptive-response sensory-kinase SasA [Fodinibius salicampi]|uniref:sensor histidine kinase n=1 Tax=Fodinibius salicampi TaxID=1920655 RepID=UPI0022450F99|nr:HAMP domain-containing sensor histidine kinase [Fodinibius salicampi]